MDVMQRKRLIGSDLVALAARQPQALADLCEQHYRDRIDALAQEILASGGASSCSPGRRPPAKRRRRTSWRRPSAPKGGAAWCSAWTTFLWARGATPKNHDGSDDYESLQSLDVPLLQQCLAQLHSEGICQAPVFDFKLQLPNGTQTVDCRGGVVIVEGLHALNPALTERLPRRRGVLPVRRPARGIRRPRRHPAAWPRGISAWRGVW